jgi:formylglycine-generating enzyme required for sulfatase activity
MATIFISHSSRNDNLANLLATWLTANGFEDFFVDHGSIRSGDKWTDELRRAKGSCRVVLCLVTLEWLASDECYGEFSAGWYAGKRLIPLVAVDRGALDQNQESRLRRVLSEDQGIDIRRVGAPDTLDLNSSPDIAEPLKAGLRAAGALAKVGLDPCAFEVDPRTQPEPFPGLASFNDTDADAAIFFGRSSEIARSLEDLREMRASGDKRAYVIVGASGSGKSSLMKAGLLPRIRRERPWVALWSFRPGADPLSNFADAVARSASEIGVPLAPGPIRDALHSAWAKGENLRATLDSIIVPLKQKLDRVDATTFIAVDQGEELVRTQGESTDALSAYLRAALEDEKEGQPVQYGVAITVRSDSLWELETAKCLEGIGTRVQNIRPLPTYRFASAIEQPCLRYGVQTDPALIETLMDESGGEDALPLLAFTLQRLWKQYSAEKYLRREHYDAIGKLSGIIEDAAERALMGDSPSASHRSPLIKIPDALDGQAAHMFLPALAQLDERGTPIRRVAPLSIFSDSERALIDAFVEWRLLVKSGESVEVTHEAIFRGWPRFQRWLVPEKERLETLRGLESAAALWSRRNRDPEYLTHRGRRLAEARALTQVDNYRAQLDRNGDARSYLDACGIAQRRRNLRIAAGLAAVAVISLLVFSIPTLLRMWAAEKESVRLQRAVSLAENYRPSSRVLTSPAEAATLPPHTVFRDCTDCPEMVVVPAGSFFMGSKETDAWYSPDEGPQRLVNVKAFALGEFDVTFDEWDTCVKHGGCQSRPAAYDHGWGRGRRPVMGVSWNDAQEYVQWVSSRAGVKYRLASEAEWEYAARAGTVTPYFTGDSISTSQANFGHFIQMTEPVGSYAPNSFGMYDIEGNAWQWVEDCFHRNYNGAPNDGSAWLDGDCSLRMFRGGDWYVDAKYLRSANRNYSHATDALDNGGFRVARSIQ